MSAPVLADLNPLLDQHPALRPILHELQQALADLADQGQETALDLHSLPLSSADTQALLDFLGTGEVSAKVHALGPSTLHETRFPGLWLVQHRNENDQLVARLLEITSIPHLLIAPIEEVRDGTQQLLRMLQPQSHQEIGYD